MKRIFLTAAIFIFLSGIIAQAQTTSVPPLINYQGRLTDNSGIGLAGTKTLEFNIYDAATGGNKIWGPQIFNMVPLIDGYFNVILGTTDTAGRSIADAFSTNTRFLGITYDGKEIAPRQQILSVPYAMQAGSVNSENIKNTIKDSQLEETIDRTGFKASGNITTLGGIHIGGNSEPGDGNLLVDGYITATNQPRCKVRLTSNKSHSSYTTWQDLEWDIADYNVGGCWNSNERKKFTAAVAGLYFLQGLIISNNTDNDYTYIKVYYLNGGVKNYIGYWGHDRNEKNHTSWLNIGIQHYMEAGSALVVEVNSSEAYGEFFGGTQASFVTFAKIQ